MNEFGSLLIVMENLFFWTTGGGIHVGEHYTLICVKATSLVILVLY